MTAVNHIARPRLLKLARQGRLVDEAFKMFSRAVYPGAGPEQVREMRVCFFAGAAELLAIQLAALDEATLEPTDEDLAFMTRVNEEIEAHHRRVIATIGAATERPQ